MDYELTDEEIAAARRKGGVDWVEPDDSQMSIEEVLNQEMWGANREVTKAQRKKLLEHIKAKCSDKSHTDIFGRKNIAHLRRYDCRDCMQALLKEHEVE